MTLSDISVSFWNWSAAFPFPLELQRASTGYTLHEQKGIKPRHLRANPETFSKIKHFEDFIFLVYNKSFQLTYQWMNIFVYQNTLITLLHP